MPYKHNESRRHKSRKTRYKVTNWRKYNEALRQRGNITIWMTEEAIADWCPAKTGSRGRPQEYSDFAIETALLIRQVFRFPLRQTEGFMNSLAELMKVDFRIPNFSNLSKRNIELPRHILDKAMEPGSIVIVDFALDSRSTAKTNGIRRSMLLLIAALGVSFIWQLMGSIRSWPVS